MKRQKKFKVGRTIELTTDAIREDRNIFASDIEQRYDGDVPNLNYINTYGTKGYSPAELKKARARHGTYYRDSMDRYNPKAKRKIK